MENVTQFQLTPEYLQTLRESIERKDDLFIAQSLEAANHADVSDILEELDSEESRYVLGLLDEELSAEVIGELESDVRTKFLRAFEPEEIARYLDHLDSDDAVDILNELPVRTREETISYLKNEEKMGYILDLLRYDEDCAGGLMAKELVKANTNWTVVQTIEEIRRQAEKVQKIYSVYVVDDSNILLGRVSLKQIVVSRADQTIADIYEKDIVSVPTYMDQEDVAALMAKYDLVAVPVVNIHGQLLGRITIDDVVDVITEQAEEERQLMSGISEDVEEDDSIWMLSRARLPWLIIGLGGGLLAARFLGLFEAELQQITAIAFFIPLIMATGGNVGIQSSALVVQSLANPSVFGETTSQKLFKVLLVAIINGVLLALIVFVFVLAINGLDYKLGLIVAFALFCVVLISSFLGTLIPLMLEKFDVNPALASGPFITTANDLVGLGVYFAVIHYLYFNV